MSQTSSSPPITPVNANVCPSGDQSSWVIAPSLQGTRVHRESRDKALLRP